MRVLAFMGTRPEYLKLWPLLRALELSPDFEVDWVDTAQHADLLNTFQRELPLKPPRYSMSPCFASLEKKMAGWFAEAEQIQQKNYDWVLTQGDTLSSWFGSQWAFFNQLPVAHLEAGMRSGSLEDPWPEEGIRKGITQIARLHFAPFAEQRSNLLKEGVQGKDVFLVGNSLRESFEFIKPEKRALSQKQGVLMTAHRRNLAEPELRELLFDLVDFLNETGEKLTWVAHPRFSESLKRETKKKGVQVLEPLGYRALLQELNLARKVLTDSGGIQEECLWLGVDTGLLRERTEWENPFPLLGFQREAIQSFLQSPPRELKEEKAKVWDVNKLLMKWKNYVENSA